MAYIKKIWTDYPDTTTQIKAEDLNNIENGIEAVDTVVNSGWTPLTGTFTYSSWDSSVCTGVVNSNLDVTGLLSVGMKVKFTQNSAIKYAFITAISSTQLTLFLGTDYTLTNAGITDAYYSMVRVPYGFPLDLSKWSLSFTSTNSSTLTAGSGYTSSPYYLTLPIGLWNARYSISLYGTGNGGLSTIIHAGLGISSLIQETRDMKSSINGYTPNQHCAGTLKGATQINITTQSDLHIYVGYGNTNGNATLNAYAEAEPTRIDATIAYL